MLTIRYVVSLRALTRSVNTYYLLLHLLLYQRVLLQSF
jgi:hypothetical protein